MNKPLRLHQQRGSSLRRSPARHRNKRGKSEPLSFRAMAFNRPVDLFLQMKNRWARRLPALERITDA